MRSTILLAVIWISSALAVGAHAASSAGIYPDRPILLVIGSAPGSGPDIIARFMSERLYKSWSQRVVVEQLLPIPRDPSRSPLVSVIFNFDKGVMPAMMPFDGVTATMHATPRTFENFELFVNAVDLDGEVTLEVQYNTGLFDRATIQRWCALYRRLQRYGL